MNASETPLKSAPKEMIEFIARDLPAEARALYYREMLYCRNLPENDELLKILNILNILTYLMVKVPAGVTAERKKLEVLLRETLSNLADVEQARRDYHKELDSRLQKLPEGIASGIDPSVIASRITSSLLQEFTRSELPQTARALAAIAVEMKQTTAQFQSAADRLGNAYGGALADAARAIKAMESSITNAAKAAGRAAKELTQSFSVEYRWTIFALSGLALTIGLVLGILFQRWLDSPPEASVRPLAPVVESAPPDAQKPMR